MPDEAGRFPYRTLGRTGLRVSSIGLGGGGKSCLGLKKGKSEAEAARLVKRAVALGINLLDTSARNGTESAIGRGIRGLARDELIISTKATVSHGDQLCSPAQFEASLENSLRALGTDYIDIAHFHGVAPGEYRYTRAELLPVMQRLQQQGKVRFIGLTEQFDRDRDHSMLQTALCENIWDVIMVGFNIVNQSARELVFQAARKHDTGILGMFAVRRALTSEATLRAALQTLQTRGELASGTDIAEIVAQLNACQDSSIADTAYRYCRDEAAIHSVLVGTGDSKHLEENVATFGKPELSRSTRQFIDSTFGQIRDFSGN